MTLILFFIVLGVIAGILSGLIGVGGGIIIIPVLVFMLDFSQKTAQGTTLALMIPPIGLLAAWAYYKEGYVDVNAAVFISLGFILGSYFGAKYAVGLSQETLKKAFSIVLLLVAIKMFFSK